MKGLLNDGSSHLHPFMIRNFDLLLTHSRPPKFKGHPLALAALMSTRLTSAIIKSKSDTLTPGRTAITLTDNKIVCNQAKFLCLQHAIWVKIHIVYRWQKDCKPTIFDFRIEDKNQEWNSWFCLSSGIPQKKFIWHKLNIWSY